MQHLTMQDIAYIIGLYHQTQSRKQVARELGLSEYRVRRILIDNGILSDYDAAIAALYASATVFRAGLVHEQLGLMHSYQCAAYAFPFSR